MWFRGTRRRPRLWLTALAFIGGICVSYGAAQAAVTDPRALQGSSVPDSVRDRLSRGVNLSFWFSHRDDKSLDPDIWRPDRDDLRSIYGMGLRHVRVMVDESFLEDAHKRGVLRMDHFAELRRAVDSVATRDLLIVVGLDGTQDWKNHLANDDHALDEAVKLWRAVAGGLADVPPDHLVFEALNEPGIEDVARSRTIMLKLSDAIRSVAPLHTIAVEGSKYASVPELLTLVPLPDKNLVYTFHFYEPFNFTHQGADWGYPPWAKFHDFPYPSSPEAVAPVLSKLDPEARPHAEYYGQQRWNRAKVAEPLDQAAAWAKKNGVLIWCSEFGALKPFAPAGARENWLRDARELLEARGILWTHFDYVDHFGLFSGPVGMRVPDQGAIAALGLKAPR